MNAYELADELQELDAKLHLIVLFKSAEMLRQQADRIAELEKQTFFIADPEKQGEPVAWMELYYGEPNNLAWTDAELRDSGEIYKTVPLYTSLVFCTAPQTKPLSDEEICQLWKASQEDGIGISLGYTTQEHYFARLIEERHGIK